MQLITFVSAHQLLLRVVVPQIHVQVVFVSAAQMMHVVIQGRLVTRELASVAPPLLVWDKHLDHIVMQLTMFANVLRLLMLVVGQRILVPMVCANAAQMTHVAIQEKLVSLVFASAAQLILVLGNQQERTVMRQTMYASARQPLLNAQLERNALEEHVSVSTYE